MLLLCSSYGIRHLSISPDNRVFYGPSNKDFQRFLEFEANYTSNNNILFVVHASHRIYEQNYAEALRWLSSHVWMIDNVIRVDSLATYPHAIGYMDTVQVTPLLDWICPAEDSCVRPDTLLSNHPELTNRLISSDLESVGVLVTLNLNIGAVGTIEKITQQAHSLVNRFQSKYPGYEVVFTGGIPMMAAFAQASARDLSILLPIATILILGLLYAFLGSARVALLVFSLGLAASAITLGLAGFLGHTINNATSIVPLIILTLVITSSMHVVLHHQRLTENSPTKETLIAAAKTAAENNTPPVTISALTSIVGLLSLSFVDSPPLQQLGQMSAFGVLIGATMTLSVLPIFLGTIQPRYASQLSISLRHLINSYARLIESGRFRTSLAALVLIVLVMGIPRLEINDNFVDYFAVGTPFRDSTDRATELLAGPNHIEVLVSTGDYESSVFEATHLQTVKALSSFLSELDQVSNVFSFYDIMRNVAQAVSPETPLEKATHNELAQWFLVYELSLQHGHSVSDFVNQSQSESRISVLLKETSSADIQALEERIRDWEIRHSEGASLSITGENIPVAHLSELNIKSMIYGLGGSILFSALIIGIVFNSARLSIAALLSIVVPVLAGFGFWGWTIGQIGLASTAIVALTIGVVVDDAVHLIFRYLDGLRTLGLNAMEASAYSIHRAGSAISTTSIVMIGGLGVLLFSDFTVNSSFGACTCLIIALALIFDMLVLPRILVWTNS
jgi:predicted RND superfamily exporter protein